MKLHCYREPTIRLRGGIFNLLRFYGYGVLGLRCRVFNPSKTSPTQEDNPLRLGNGYFLDLAVCLYNGILPNLSFIDNNLFNCKKLYLDKVA